MMPSRRETFGIVAIQAMACGTPVIATCVGGLKHTVLDGITGQLIRSEDSASLAWVLYKLCKNESIRRTLSENALQWAQDAFHHTAAIDRLETLQNGRTLHPHPLENVGYYLYSKAVDEIRKAYGQDADLKLLSRKRHYVGKLRRAKSQPQRVLKLFRESEETDHSLFDISQRFICANRDVQMNRNLFIRDNPHAAKLKQISADLLCMEYSKEAKKVSLATIKDALNRFSSSFPSPSPEHLEGYHIALRNLHHSPGRVTLRDFDHAASKLNYEINGHDYVFTRCDPHAELLRYRLHAEYRIWPLRSEQKRKIDSICRQTLDLSVDKTSKVAGCHGDLKPWHVLRRNGDVVFCDFDESKYASGQIDIPSYLIAKEVHPDYSENCIIDLPSKLASVITQIDELNSAMQWTVVHLIYAGMYKAQRGKADLLDCVLTGLEKLIKDFRHG